MKNLLSRFAVSALSLAAFTFIIAVASIEDQPGGGFVGFSLLILFGAPFLLVVGLSSVIIAVATSALARNSAKGEDAPLDRTAVARTVIYSIMVGLALLALFLEYIGL